MVLRKRYTGRRYDLEQRVGVGGMGEVYKARAPDLDRKLAIKRMLSRNAEDPELRQLFLREITIAATLEHHNVVEVIDAGRVGSELFLVMERISGPSLAEVIEVLRRDNMILPVELCCGIVGSIANGLAHAHERARPDGTPLGIIHRDLAPENILLSSDGVPKILDFGLATLDGHTHTQPGVIRGRPRSLSPEQARGDPIDVRADVFALGAILFELTSGQSLYPDEPLATLLWKVAAGDYGRLDERLAHLDPDLVKIIQRALAPRPEDRFPSARVMERALDAFRAGRGMPVSREDVVRAIAHTWPQISVLRKSRREEDGRGELEGARLVLPAEGTRTHDLPRTPLPDGRLLRPGDPSMEESETTADLSALPLPTLRPERRKLPKLGWALYTLGVLAATAACGTWVWAQLP